MVTIGDEAVSIGVVAIQAAAVRSDPDRPRRILDNTTYEVAAETAGIAGIVNVVRKRVRCGIEYINSPGFGADPNRSVPRFAQRSDDVVIHPPSSSGVCG